MLTYEGTMQVARAAAQAGSNALLRAQLAAGQHLLDHPLAIRVGATLGMKPSEVVAAGVAR